jgi:uracil-DNA glycosylase
MSEQFALFSSQAKSTRASTDIINTQPITSTAITSVSIADTPITSTKEISIAEETTSKRWKDLLKDELQAPYYLELKEFIKSERAQGKRIYPPDHEILNAINLTPFEQVKVVIIGQDPYHGADQAHGLCFSVRPPVPPPPSLKNIFKELNSDLGIRTPTNGSLERWAKQGVLLLNTVLTVEAGRPASHQNRGWERFTDKVIEMLVTHKRDLVFLLWGAHAQKKTAFIDPVKHHLLKAAHPSPYSASNGFFGCKHFSKTNEILQSHGIAPVDWGL